LGDANSLTTTCLQTINISDTSLPTWTTPVGSLNRTIECNNSAGLSAAELLFPIAVDNCDADVTNVVKITGGFTLSGGCPMAGTYTNTWTVKDDCGNTSETFNQVITIVDSTPPSWMTAPGALNVTVDCSDAASLAEAQAMVPAASDICDAGVLTLLKTSGIFMAGSTCPKGGTYTNTWKAKDICGNPSADFIQIITVVDQLEPTWVTFPGAIDRSIACNDPAALASAQALIPIATDICDEDVTNIVKVSGTFAPAGSMCPGSGTYTNKWTVTDDCGNISDLFTQVINFGDNIAPEIRCPGNTAIGYGNPSDPSATGTATATDNCNTVITAYSDVPIPGSCAGNYTIARTWKATDACGNFSTCLQTIYVQDVVKPVIVCTVSGNQAVDYNSISGYIHPDVTWDATATDNAGIVTLSVSITGATNSGPLTSLNGVTFHEGLNTVTWTAIDDCGNINTCQFTVIVRPGLRINCLADISHNTDAGVCSATFNPGLPTVISGAEPISWSYKMSGATTASGNTQTIAYPLNKGITLITWTASNLSGTVECSHNVTILDKEPPTFTPPSPFEFCVENLLSAVFVSNNLKINPDPDYYIFRDKSPVFNLDPAILLNNFKDNCCTGGFVIHWSMEFTDIPNPANPPAPAMLSHSPIPDQTGQPSLYGSDIKIPGDGVNFTPVVHTITYWLVDCNGNKSLKKSVNVTIRPRPKLL